MSKKFLVVSDLHGSLVGLERTIELMKEYSADKLLLLGDIFGINASEMIEILNGISARVTLVRGNNDWYYEFEDLKVPFMKDAYENINGRMAYLSHGHRLNDMYLEGYNAKIVMIGHVHRPILREERGVILLCPGSIAVPRGGSDKTFALIDDKKIQILNLDGEIIDELDY